MRDFHGKGRSPKGHPSKLQQKGFTPKEPAPPRSKQRYNREAPRPVREAPRPLQRRGMPVSAPIASLPQLPPEDRGGPGRIAGGNEREREIVYGVEPIRELVAAAAGSIRVLYVKSGDERRFANEIDRVRTGGGRVEFADEAGLERMAGLTARHQGIAALMREYEYAPFEAILEQKPDPIVVVDGVTDPRNLGALMRSAEGAGVGAIVLARDRTSGITPAAVKSSAGAWIHLRIARCGNVARALEQLKNAGYWIAALAPGGETKLYDLDTTRKLAIVVGSEDRGVREIVRKGADFVVDIPMRGKVNSLNVSVAAAVALFEIARQRESTAAARS